jgi:flagellar hook protein FlgE
MAFQQGLSGLNAASKTMETIGNNVANAGTVGFKKSQAQFADVYASSLMGSGASAIGIGVKLARVSQQFTQSNISGTNNPLDIAINGDGFFRMSDAGAITYTRNGQFQLTKNGNIENANGAVLTGYPVGPNGQIANGAPVALQINSTAIAPQPTTSYDVRMNLDSQETPIAPATTPFDPNDDTTYHGRTSVGVYDSLGNPHTLSTFYRNVGDGTGAAPAAGTGNKWEVFATLDGNDLATGVAPLPAMAPLTTIDFDLNGAPTSSLSMNTPVILLNNGAVMNPAGATPKTIAINFAGTTQFRMETAEQGEPKQDGYAAGSLVSFGIGSDGNVVGSYTNGQTALLGQVALASFANPNGLTPQGDNAWVETSISGPPLVGAPGVSGLGLVQSSAVEESNVDLTAELVAMITAQRIYQANAQTIKTEDQVMQTLVNLR